MTIIYSVYVINHIHILNLISPGDLDAKQYKSDSVKNDEVDQLSWSMCDKGDHILYNGNILECTRAMEGEDNHSMIFTDQPIPKHIENFYFEVTIEDDGEHGWIGVGLAKASAKYHNGHMPGWDKGTIGYHGDDGGIYHNCGSLQLTCETYGKGDTVGCMMKKEMIDNYQYTFVNFFKNGKNLMVNRYVEEGEYYPTIGMGSAGAKVTSNLGETDFTYKIVGT